MAVTSSLSTLNPFATKPKEQKASPLDRMGFFEEMGGFNELIPNPEKLVADGGSFLKESIGAIGDLFKQDVLPAQGSINFNEQNKPPTPEAQKKQEVASHQRQSYNILQEATQIVHQREQELNMKEAARLMVAGMSNEEKNAKLHLSSHYKEQYKGPYHLQILRVQMVEELKAAQKSKEQQSAVEVAGPKGPDFDKNKANEMGPTSIYNAAG